MNISEISGTMVSDPSTATNQIIVDTGDGLQRAIATSAVSGTIVSDESIETTDCIVDTGSGLQRAIKVAGSGGGGGSSTKYGASIDNFLGDVDENGVLQAPSEAANFSFTGVKDIASEVMKNAYYLNKNIGAVSFPDLTNLSNGSSLYNAFYQSSMTSVSFPKLANVSGTSVLYNAFSNSPITSVSFPELQNINSASALQNMCSQCTSLTSASFPKLKTITQNSAMQNAFSYTKLTSIEFTSLETVQGSQAMRGCFDGTTLTSLSFPALKNNFNANNIFNSMLQDTTGCTVHFPSNLQSVIGSWSSVTAGFGGTNTTVLFDLPATE